MRFKNTVSMSNRTEQNRTEQNQQFKLFKNQSKKIIKILSVSFGYINFDNLSGEKKPDFVINKKFFIKGDNKMKKIKKFLLTIAMTMIFSVSAFAASRFEFILNVPFGLSVGFESVDLSMLPGDNRVTQWKIENASPGIGFDIGVAAQLGYMFQVKEGFGISVLEELGYIHDTISGTYGKIETGNGLNFSGIKAIYTLEQFQIGLLPKFNIGAFSIGIGGGVKIPLTGKYQINTTFAIENATTREGVKSTVDINLERQDIVDLFSPSVIGYKKIENNNFQN